MSSIIENTKENRELLDNHFKSTLSMGKEFQRIPMGTNRNDLDNVNATYVSIWDDNKRIESNCKYNPTTREVTDVDVMDVDSMDLDSCTKEFIELPDGTEILDFNYEDGIWVNGERSDFE